jgi:hypothetical protein
MKRRSTLAVLVGVLIAAALAPAAAPRVPKGEARAPLPVVRQEVDRWLVEFGLPGFYAAEVMAFTNNDYVAVADAAGNPAFELLVAADASWVMEEPPSMMWNAKYGMFGHLRGSGGPLPGLGMMMGGSGMMGSGPLWFGSGSGKVTSLAQARAVASSWLAESRPGEVAEADGRAFPGYYTLDTTLNGKTHGMLSVNASTGAVWYHGWHGTFVAEHAYVS